MHTPERLILYVVIATTVIVAGIISYFIFSMVRQFRHHHQVQNDSDRAKIEALDKERRLIAADLHDDIGPILSATLLKLAAVEPTDPFQIKTLQESTQHIDSIFIRIRDLALMLSPQDIEDSGPLYAFEYFKEKYGATPELNVLIYPVPTKGLTEERALHVYRMLQEIFHNTVRHSQADNFVVTAEVNNARLVINSSDDGVGFDVHAMNGHPGLGLKNLAIRAKILGAAVNVESGKGRGTRYRIELQLKDKN